MIKKIIDFFSISTAHHISYLFSLVMIVLCLSIHTGLGTFVALLNLVGLFFNLKFCFDQYFLLQRLRDDLRKPGHNQHKQELLEPLKYTICGRQIVNKLLKEMKG
jgi:hypothetical protein